METKSAQTMSFAPKPPRDRGAGGKVRKPPSRRPPSTPYARPTQNQEPRGRWLSKLVDPALRLISGGANLIFPSFFSKSQSINSRTAPTGEEENQEFAETANLHKEVEENAGGDEGDFTVNLVESKVTGLAGSSRLADGSPSKADLNGQEQNQEVEVSDPDGLSEIEQLLKDKRFSRAEIKHLVEIINSRALDLPDLAQTNVYSTRTAGDHRESTVALEYSGKSIGANLEDLNRALCETSKNRETKYSSAMSSEAEKQVALEKSSKSTDEHYEGLDRIIWKPSTPIFQSKPENDVGTSPIDIARAYMENRTSEMDFGTGNLMSRDEKALPCSDELALKPFFPSPLSKSSPRWPGAMVQDQRVYATPQIQRGKFGLQSFPRTPYSRTIHSRTMSRVIHLQGNSDRHPRVMATPFQPTKTPSSGQVYSRSNALNVHNGSVGSIRRGQHKVTVETPRGSVHFPSSLNSGQWENLSVSEGLFSVPKPNVENGRIDMSVKFESLSSKPQSSEVRVPSAPAHSSQVAQKILEHLERNPPTRKDKSAELRLATSWRKSQSSEQTTFTTYKLNRLTNSQGRDSSEKSIQVSKDNTQEFSNEVDAVVNNNTLATDMKGATLLKHGEHAVPLQDFTKAQDVQLNNAEEAALKAMRNSTGSEVLNLQKKSPPQSSSTKPVLPSIAIDKPHQRWTFSSDNNSLGFSFPVSTASGGSYEPPTPSIMPSSSSVIGQVQQNEGSSIPSYSFGSRSSIPALSFSFPSTRSVSVEDDASDLKFNFGSDESLRLSFASVGQDAICY